MKIFMIGESPIVDALVAVAKTVGCEIVTDDEIADKVLCIDANKALDLLLSGKEVILVVFGRDTGNADALGKNERFKNSITVFKFSFDENDTLEMVRFMDYCASYSNLTEGEV